MEFRWTGRKVDPYCDKPSLVKGPLEYYTSFIYNGEKFRVGEFAIFQLETKAVVTKIGRLLCVFQSCEEAIKYNGVVRWYIWAKDLRKKFNTLDIKFDENNEIVEETTSIDTLVSLTDIKKKCNVVCAALTEPTYLIKAYNFNPEIFFSCRYKIKDNQLIPYFLEQNGNNEDYIVSSELNGVDGSMGINEDNSTDINDVCPLTETTPFKTSPTKSTLCNKRKSYHALPVINLDSEGSNSEEEYGKKVRSTLIPAKNLKSTSKSVEKNFNESPLKRNLSVKRVLNDSFDDHSISPSGIPIFSYSVVNLNSSDPKQIKMKLKLTENDNNVKLKVFPTKLSDDIVQSNSPVKLTDIREINNRVEFSPKSNLKITENRRNFDRTPYTRPQAGSSGCCSSRTLRKPSYIEYFSEEEDTPKKRLNKGTAGSRRNKEMTESNRTLKKINACHESNIDDKHIIKVEDLKLKSGTNDTPKRNDNKNIMTSNKQIASATKQKILEQLTNDEKMTTPSRSKRNAGPPKRYTDYDNSTVTNSTLKRQHSNDNANSVKKSKLTHSGGCYKKHHNDDDNDKNTNSARVPRNVGRPKRYGSEELENSTKTNKNKSKKSRPNTPSKTPSSTTKYKKQLNNVDIENSTHEGSDSNKRLSRPSRSVGRPRNYLESDTSDSDSNVKSLLNNRKTPKKTPHTNKKKLDDSIRKSVLKSSCKKLTYAESDEDDLEPQTPKTPRHKSTPRSAMKDTPTARARMVREGVITPSVHIRNKSVAKNDTPLSKARTQLHASFVPKSLPCREKEYADIFNFLEGKLLDGCGGCMYVSGVPGTGKTATVTEVIRNLQIFAETGELPSFKYCNVNGMKLSEPRQSYVEIMRQLTGKTVYWEQAQTMLENRFVKTQKKSAPIILVVDELDILCTQRQDVVYNLLDWPTKANAQLIVITIANTMDLPERLLMGRVTSRLGLTRLTFQAYSHKQLQEIVSKRLAGIGAFNQEAIQLVSRKVASVSGDARRALDICRRAVEIAELEGKDTLVSMTHIDQTLNAMITQPKVQAIKRCSRLEKLLLQAVVAEVERTGVEETNFASILTMLVSLAALDGFRMVSSTTALAAVSKLGACRLLLTDQNCNDIHQRIILNVSTDDVYYAMTKTDI